MERTHLHAHPTVRGAQYEALRARRRWIITLAAPLPVAAGLVSIVLLGLVGRPSTWLLVLLVLAAVVAVPVWVAAVRSARRRDRMFVGVWKDFAVVVEHADEQLVEAHTQAVEILEDHRRHGGAFLLFLRSFEPEAAGWLSPEGMGTQGTSRDILTPQAGPTDAEKELVRVVGERPFLGIANPFTFKSSDDGVPARLQLPNDGWFDVLRELVESAHTIVVDLPMLAPGVEAELAAIAAAGRAQDTLVVVPSPSSRVLGDIERTRTIAEVMGVVAPEATIATRNHEKLAGFPHVVEWDQEIGDTLLRKHLGPRLRSLDAANVHAMNHHAVELINEGKHKEALGILERALELALAAEDETAQAVTYADLAVVYFDGLGDRESALAAAERSLELYRAVGDDEGARTVTRTLGLLLMEGGEDDKALRYLLR
jgi:Tetratricopeptide repeat